MEFNSGFKGLIMLILQYYLGTVTDGPLEKAADSFVSV